MDDGEGHQVSCRCEFYVRKKRWLDEAHAARDEMKRRVAERIEREGVGR